MSYTVRFTHKGRQEMEVVFPQGGFRARNRHTER